MGKKGYTYQVSFIGTLETPNGKATAQSSCNVHTDRIISDPNDFKAFMDEAVKTINADNEKKNVGRYIRETCVILYLGRYPL